MNCPSCGITVDAACKYCPECGVNLSTVVPNSDDVVEKTATENNFSFVDRGRYMEANPVIKSVRRFFKKKAFLLFAILLTAYTFLSSAISSSEIIAVYGKTEPFIKSISALIENRIYFNVNSVRGRVLFLNPMYAITTVSVWMLYFSSKLRSVISDAALKIIKAASLICMAFNFVSAIGALILQILLVSDIRDGYIPYANISSTSLSVILLSFAVFFSAMGLYFWKISSSIRTIFVISSTGEPHTRGLSVYAIVMFFVLALFNLLLLAAYFKYIGKPTSFGMITRIVGFLTYLCLGVLAIKFRKRVMRYKREIMMHK